MGASLINALIVLIKAALVLSNCEFPTHTENHLAMQKIKPLVGHSWSANDNDMTPDFNYVVTVCGGYKDEPNAGVVQKKVAKPEDPAIIVGDIRYSTIMGGAEWVQLEYAHGENYSHSCHQEARRAHVMITCDETATQGILTVVEENKNKTQDCYYLFELAHAVMCAPKTKNTSLSSGSIFCIVFICVVGLYLLAGLVYQRLVVGAKGWEQIPNYSFWQDFGNLQADGCDFICRTGSKSVTREYRGIGDDQLPDSGVDDSLLPM